jgi:hypothetical protein
LVISPVVIAMLMSCQISSSIADILPAQVGAKARAESACRVYTTAIVHAAMLRIELADLLPVRAPRRARSEGLRS